MTANTKAAPKLVRRDDYRPPDWLIDQVELHFDIQESFVEVRSQLDIRRSSEHERPLVLDGRHMRLQAVYLDGHLQEESAYQLDDSSLTLTGLPPKARLEIHTRIDPSSNTALEGLYAAGDMLCSQCEAHGFSRITYFPDRPDVLAKYRVTIEADATRYPILLSNGNRLEQTELDDGRQRVVWEDPFAKPCYLFALVAGDLACVTDQYRTQSGRQVCIEFYVEHGSEALCGHAISSLKQAMTWDEQTYGLEYDLDIYMVVAVSSFNMGAMENKGLNVFNDRFVLVSPETATDTDYETVTAIIGHEYFHNWTGNRVTCRDWFQLSLKEGLTVFREQQFMQDCVGGSTQRIEQVRILRERQFPEDAGPLSHPVRPDSYLEINNFYTATVYEKGAELVRMLHGMLGQAAFTRALQDYLKRHDGQAATIEDFVAAMQRETDIDLQSFFAWYSQAGTPEVSVTDRFDAASGRYQLDFKQITQPTPGQAIKKPLLIPLQMGLLDTKGESKAAQLFTLDAQSQQLELSGLESNPTPVFLRGFSAPVRLYYPYSAEQLGRIVLHEADGYSRWEAMQRLYMRHILEDVPADSLIEVLQKLLAQDQDAGSLAELLNLPTENQLLDQASVPFDLDALLQQRDTLLQQLSRQLGDSLRERSAQLSEVTSAGYSHTAAAQRRLRAVCLNLLLKAADQERQQFAWACYQQAGNMSDALASLQALRDVDCAEREQAMSDFRQRWSGNALVLDKWFSLQACTQFGDPAQRVRALMADPGFELKNPNRVRSLIGAFAMNNPRGLHAADGSGYALMGELLPQLDALNPQVSARMAQAFSSWRRLDSARQQQIEAMLNTVLDKPGLSADLFEIVTKILASSDAAIKS